MSQGIKLTFKTGSQFSRLTAIRETSRRYQGSVVWECQCQCGNQCFVSASNMQRGRVRSCGCLLRETAAHNGRTGGHKNRTHGKSYSREYSSWTAMIQRCTNPNANKFNDYGGRGIKICERWLNSFEMFLSDIGPRPIGKSLDRKDVNGNYDPSNCKWSSKSEQNRNTRRKRIEDFSNDELLRELRRRYHQPGNAVWIEMQQAQGELPL